MSDTESNLERIERLLAESTSGQWSITQDDTPHRGRDVLRLVSAVTLEERIFYGNSARSNYIATIYGSPDAQLIAAAPELLRWAVDRIKELERQNAEAAQYREAIRQDEREVCERICNTVETVTPETLGKDAARTCAILIRNRGTKR